MFIDNYNVTNIQSCFNVRINITTTNITNSHIHENGVFNEEQESHSNNEQNYLINYQ